MVEVLPLLERKQVAMRWGGGKASEEVACLGSLVFQLSRRHLKGPYGVLVYLVSHMTGRITAEVPDTFAPSGEWVPHTDSNQFLTSSAGWCLRVRPNEEN